MIKKIGLSLASIAPGIFMVGYNIGTGSITTIASSGAAYGMALVSPPALILLLLLYNKKKSMGKHTANLTTNLILGIITLFTILMALAGVIGILNLLK